VGWERNGLGNDLHVEGEIGTVGYELSCVFAVGVELVCDVIILHGTDGQKERSAKR